MGGTFEYDAAGNMTAKQTPNLRTANGKIQYTYDYERLSEIIYPKNIYNRVTYTYGDTSETKYNRAGRLKLVEDGSGGEAYYYGKLGEVTKTIKSIILAETNIRTYIWEADYDSWNRIRTMTYPDGEVVTYTYDKGGNLNSITTEKDGDKQTLIAEQRYDKYGNLTYRKMGNGTETTYNYDEKRLHLNTMSLTSNGVKMMENVYKYDNVDNILGISNAAAPSGEIGGTYSHSYQYDELNRLISASGTAKDRNYELLMRYDVMSNPLQKDSVWYEYNTPNHPNAVSSAGNKLFTYDANGNPISVEDTAANTLRVMQWDEENRLQSLGDDGYVSRYTYNHAGERVIKSHGPTTVAFVNGAPQGILWHDKDNWTMYVSPYMVVNSDRFTKHYYAGSQRIASKIGAGEFDNLYDASKACVTAGQKDYAERMNLITQSRNDYYAALGIPPGPPTAKGIYGEAEYSGAYGDYSLEPLGNYDVPTGWPMKSYKRPYGGTPGAPVMYEKPSDPEDEGAGYGYSNAEGLEENDIYFYHSDHLGSTSYITDKDCNATQFVCYKPYGEALVDEHNTSYEQPWKFNGKELDAETGLYYYGARYYEPVLALWYGVDALAEKYPSMGGYVYCAGNPVKLVDPDGDSPTLATAAIGAVLGGIVGGAIEIGSQLYQNGEVSDWSAVGGASAQGAITGAAAGLTCGASLLVTTSVSGAANVLGGTVNRTIQGQDTNLNDVLSDATIGAVFGAGGKLIGNGVNCFSSVQSQATNQLKNIASKVLTNMGPGKGSVYGTKVHSAFAKAANGLKIGDCTIRTEVSYLNGKVVAYGTKGSARIDAGLYNSKGELIQVFDLKTGGAK